MNKENVITSGSEITLGWVSHEINLCLVQSKQYLEAYQEHGDRNDLEECRKQIHQLRNTLIVINLYGASMLAEELEAVVHFLQEQTDGSSERSVLEAISTGIVSLQDYLERVEKGAPDVPVILLPVLNELRASRQKHLLSESAFFSPKLKEFLAIELAEPYEENGELKNFISENRTSFHRSLLKWYQDSDASSGLSTIREILNGAALRASKPVSRLFSLGSELAYLIWSHPSESSMATKLVVGQLDAIFRKILATGEEGLRQDFPVERLRNLLFYIGRSKTDSPDISKLKEEYSLETEIVYGALSGKSAEMPSPGTVDAVREALNTDITEVKDALDIYNRSVVKDDLILESLVPRLRQVADTAGMLGLGSNRKFLQDHIEVINGCLSQNTPVEAGFLDRLASDLLLVESSLPDLFYAKPSESGKEDQAVSSGELQQYTTEALDETQTEIAKVKDVISKALNADDHSKIKEVPPLLDKINGVMQMLNLEKMATRINTVSGYIGSAEAGERAPLESQERIDKLADIISGMEYYLEVAPYQCRQEQQILDYIDASYAELDALDPLKTEEKTELEQSRDVDLDTDKDISGVAEEPSAIEPEVTEKSDVETLQLEEEQDNIIDDEIREIFRQEAEEQLDAIAHYYPRWKKNHENREALQTVRRAFHTLKGSGRTVGATTIGDFSWEIENLFNHIIDGVVQPEGHVLGLIDRAIDFLPGLMEDDAQASGTERENIERQARAIVSNVFEPEDVVDEARQVEEIKQRAEFLVDAYGSLIAAVPLMKQCSVSPDTCERQPLKDAIQEIFTRAETAGDEEICNLVHGWSLQVGPDADITGMETLAKEPERLNRILIKRYSLIDFSVTDELQEIADEIESMQESFREVDSQEPQILRPAEEEQGVDHLEPGDTETGEHASIESQADNDLLPIFLDEAKELNEGIDAVFARVSGTGSFTAESVIELKRLLHTLKGAARLTGHDELGDVTHAFEAMLIQSESDQQVDDKELFRRSRGAADFLHHQVEKLEKGETLDKTSDILKLLEPVRESEQPVQPGDASFESLKTEEAPKDEPGTGEERQSGQETAIESDEQLEVAEPIQTKPLKDRISADIVAFPKRRQPRLREDARKRVRISTALLDKLVDGVGEVITFGSRLQEQRNSITANLSEFEQTLTRLREQLRSLEIEAETQILSHYQRDGEYHGDEGFDPLELDQYSAIQEHSRALAETISDLGNISTVFDQAQHEIDLLLSQHSRLTSDLQDVLLHTRTVPFSQHVARLTRLVRQTCASTGKRAGLQIIGEDEEMDRGILDRTIPLIEHLLRNAVYHGIETPEERLKAGKTEKGQITLTLERVGMEIVLQLIDDGKGFDRQAIRSRAIQKELISEEDTLSDEDILRLATLPGFSTADGVDQISGRGVGLDVVVNEIENLGGRLNIESVESEGSRFTIRFPFNIAITDALMVHQQGVWYAIPSASIDTVVRVTRNELDACYSGIREGYSYGDNLYRVVGLSDYFNQEHVPPADTEKWHSLLLVSSGDKHIALHPEEVHGHSQVVLKSVGPQLESVPWIVGGTVKGDGNAALVIDPAALISIETRVEEEVGEIEQSQEQPQIVMVVDDSITMRKVTGAMLERNGFNIVTAKDGVDALAELELVKPDIILLDIEMPRMDGFEFARHLRNNEHYHDIPIIMVTSRTGEKHRERAMELAIESYLGKPFQESELLDNITDLIGEKSQGK